MRAVRDAAAETFAQLCPSDLSARRAGRARAAGDARPRPDDYRLSLLTGNFEPIARLKLARAGLGRYFEPGQGGVRLGRRGSRRSCRRSRARAPAAWPRERTVVIGDTPRDIACARADGVRVVAVATGPFGVEALADADAVVDDARALLPVLKDWVSGRS